ncbi:MAG: type II toxin-antitoxin system RelE/ParE family toxin [Ignavibacterium sp.]|nr:type II toxin-antitoxin system RelE/ParE family toxin [Ignavibacterium sp.]HCY74529.1 plasmid stabilization protein [Ignavibacteriales bacterium]
MKIVWSPLSYERLENIYEFIFDKDPVAAKNLINSVFERIESLSRFPERGRKVPEINRDEIREVFVSEYRIIYKIEPNKISIITIRNFKQLLPKTDIK